MSRLTICWLSALNPLTDDSEVPDPPFRIQPVLGVIHMKIKFCLVLLTFGKGFYVTGPYLLFEPHLKQRTKEENTTRILQVFFDQLQQFIRLEWLTDITIHPGCHASFFVFGKGICRDRNYRSVRIRALFYFPYLLCGF